MSNLSIREYYDKGRIATYVFLLFAGLIFIVLDFKYYILSPVWVNKLAGQDRTILDIGRSVSIVMVVISGYYAFTRHKGDSLDDKLFFWLKYAFFSLIIACVLVFLFIVVVLSTSGP